MDKILFQMRYVKKHKLTETQWSAFWTGPPPTFKVTEAKNKKSKKKEAVIDLTGEKKKKGRPAKEGKKESK